jgi:DNA-binding Lrp family transcriptional regulator
MSDPRPAVRLDHVDRRIVAALQADPRGSWAQLGAVVDVSETTVLRRVQRMRDGGVLEVVAAPDPLHCGFGQPVLLQFRTVPGKAPALARYLAERADSRFVALLTGRSDVLCELIAPDRRYLSQFLNAQVPTTGAVLGTTSDTVLRTFKTRDQWSRTLLDPDAAPATPSPSPIAPAEKDAKLDKMDLRLLAALGGDGRRSYADLSAEVGLSETAIARRISALTAANKLYFVAMVDSAALGFDLEVMVRLRVELAALESIASELAAMPEVRYISATTGYSDLAFEGIFKDTNALYDFVTHALGALKGIREVEVDVMLDIIKRAYRYPLFAGGSPAKAGVDTAPGTSRRAPEKASRRGAAAKKDSR